MKKLLALFILLAFMAAPARAQDSTATDSSPKLINDYSMIGVSYGVTFSNMYFSPTKHRKQYVFAPNYVSIMFTKHCKMFDTMPLFAIVGGVAMGNEGFAFEPDKETGETTAIDGATWCSMKVFEVPVMAQLHIDSDPFKIMADAGIY